MRKTKIISLKSTFVILALLCALFATALPTFASGSDGKSELIAELNRFEAADEKLYTTASYAAWKNAHDSGIIVNNTPGSTEAEIAEATAALKAAYSALVLKGNKAPLAELLSEISSIDLSPYTPQTADALKSSVEAAQTVLDDIDASQADVDGAIADLLAKKGMLWRPADFSSLVGAIEAAKTIDLTPYTTKSVEAFKAALAVAEAVAADRNSAASSIEAAEEKLLRSESELVKRGNTSALIAAINEIKSMTMIYTSESVSPLLNKCDEALLMIGEGRSRTELDEMLAELKALKSNLVINSKKYELYNYISAIASADIYNGGDTVDEERLAAYNAAQSVMNDPYATEGEIGNAINSIKGIISGEIHDNKSDGFSVFGWVLLIIGLICAILMIIAGGVGIADYGGDEFYTTGPLVCGIILTVSFIVLICICAAL